MSIIACIFLICFLLWFVWIVFTNLYEIFAPLLTTRFGDSYRIVMKKEIREDSYYGTKELKDVYYAQVRVFDVWLNHSSHSTLVGADDDIRKIKQYRRMVKMAKESKGNKEIIKEDKL